VALLGTIPDDEAAARAGRTLTAVWQKRFALGIASACNRRKRVYMSRLHSSSPKIECRHPGTP
jgi:hypothetical protein